MRHALIIGPRRVGKSTLIQRVLHELNRPVFGYETKKEPSLEDEELGNPIYIYEPGKPRTQSPENLMGYCKKHRFQTLEGGFNRYAKKLLEPAPENGIILFDEIGFMESTEQQFCDALLKRFDGDIPVIAGVKDKDFPFLNTVRNHPNCRCFYITEENRDALYQDVLDFMMGQFVPNAKDLAYFASLQNKKSSQNFDHSAKKWDHRANVWKKDRALNRKGDDRVQNAITLLEHRGILHENCDVVDIGCGPGRFVAAFAKKAHFALGLDISENMVAHGMEHIQECKLTNAHLRTCNFEELDLKKEGYFQAFDLVFSSLTPAIHDLNSLKKSMELSRAWCCNVTHLHRHNHLRARIMKDVYGKTLLPQSYGSWFYSLFNLLFLMGYFPEITYDNRYQEIFIQPSEEYVDFIMEHMLPLEEQTKEQASRILEWMKVHANEDGLLLEVSEGCYATVLWDIRNKVDRPDFRLS